MNQAYLMKLALRPWRAAPWSQVFSALMVAFMAILAAGFVWLDRGLKPVMARLSQEQVVTAFVDPSVDAKDEERLLDSIRTSLGASAERAEMRVVKTEAFLSDLESVYPQMAKDLREMGNEASEVVPRYVSITGVMGEDAVARVKGVTGIESADSSRDRYAPILASIAALRRVARFMAIGLSIALLTGLVHLTRMNAYLHRDAVAVLRLWGAGPAVLRAPSLISGLAVGLAGGALAGVTWLACARSFAAKVHALSPDLMKDLPAAPPSMALTLLLAGGALGLLAGLAGARQGSAQP